MEMTIILKGAALTHLGLIAAGALMPKAVDLWKHVKDLPPFIRRLFKVYYVFIGFMLLSFGLLTWIHAEELASGTPLAQAVSVVMALFWTIRLVVAGFVFDVRPYLTNVWYRIGYAATNVVFGLLPGVYALAAWKGGAL